VDHHYLDTFWRLLLPVRSPRWQSTHLTSQRGSPSNLSAFQLSLGFNSIVSLDWDVHACSRMMNQKVDPLTRKGMLYSNMGDCFVKTVSKEGVFALWKGCFASYLRVGPRVLVIFVIMEQLKARF
jgi:Mitochondrial carrier protein